MAKQLSVEARKKRYDELYAKEKAKTITPEEQKEIIAIRRENYFSRYFTNEKKWIVFSEKHGDRHFDASTPELLGKAVLKVLKDRLADDYWYDDTREVVYAVNYTFTKDKKQETASVNITNVPDETDEAELRKRVRLQLIDLDNLNIGVIEKKYTTEYSDKQKAKKILERAKTDKVEGVRDAFRFLWGRSTDDYQYERCEFIYPEKA